MWTNKLTRNTHRLEIVDIVDGEILRDVEQKIVRKRAERHGVEMWTMEEMPRDGCGSGRVVVEDEDERGSSGIREMVKLSSFVRPRCTLPNLDSFNVRYYPAHPADLQ